MLGDRLQLSRTALRLSHAEREQALRALKTHYAEGRLSTDELEARVEDVYRSETVRQVAVPLRALPTRGLRGLVVFHARRLQRTVLRMHLATSVGVNVSIVGVWAISGQGVFWPALFLIPSAVLLGWHIAASRALTRALSRHSWTGR